MSANLSGTSSGGASGGGGGGGSGGATSGSSGGGPCGACKFLRRKCVAGCIFAPYFDSEQGAAHFAAVHKVFGASNVSKLLLHIPVHKRLDAVVTICYEAQARLRDPVYGCVAHIFALQQQVVNLQAELTYLQAHLAALDQLPTQPAPPPQPPHSLISQPQLTIADLPSASSMPATYDLSMLFEPTVQQPSWTMQQQQQQQRQVDPRQFAAARAQQDIPSSTGGHGDGSNSGGGGGGDGDLQALALELLHRHESPPIPCTSTTGALPLPPHSE